MSLFISGLDLNEQFYLEVIRPLLAAEFPGLVHAAARLGSGSDVLGYDDRTSTDHDWGIRQQIFLMEADVERVGTAVNETLRHQLPYTFRGYSVHFGPPDEEGTRLRQEVTTGPVDHRIEVTTVTRFFQKELGFDPLKTWQPVDWVSVAQQQLLHVTAGRVFADDWGELTRLRQKFTWYPQEVWLYLLACQWGRMGQEEHLMGRAGFVGDDIGSRLMAARLVRDLMQLGFLMEKLYTPYPKWFGTAFSRLTIGPALNPIFKQVLQAETWQAREASLCVAYEFMAEQHNKLGLTPWLRPTCESFFNRPFRVIMAGRFEQALRDTIQNEQVKQLTPSLGSIDQFSDSTDLRSNPTLFGKLRPLYQK
jgi:hypothetical protein